MVMDLSFGSTAFPRAQEVRERLYESGCSGSATTSRQAALARLADFWHCREYDHCKLSWDGFDADRVDALSPNVIVPFGNTQPADAANQYQKRPTMPERLGKTVVSRFTGLLFSEKRRPKVSVSGDEVATAFLEACFKQGSLWSTMVAARNFGGAMGSALVVVGIKDGKFRYEAIDPQCVFDIIWKDESKKIPHGVLIQYAFAKERQVWDNGRLTKVKGEQYVYRRIIDETHDIVFQPSLMEKDGSAPETEVESIIEHGLGRFPGCWIQNLPNEFDWDGIPDADGQFQTFVGIDRQNAQTDRALKYTQDPTIVFGRDKKYDSMGIERDLIITGVGRALNVGVSGHAEYMEISGTGLQQAREFTQERKQSAMDAVQCIIADPEKIAASAQSAKAIELIYAPMLEKADQIRVPYGDAIEIIAELTLELGRLWGDPKAYASLPNPVDRVFFLLPPRAIEKESGVVFVEQSPGHGRIIVVAWGPYFPKTPSDVQAEVNSWATAFGAGLAPLEHAARATAEALEVDDVDAYVAAVVKEHHERQAKLLAMAQPQDGLGMDMAAEYDRRIDAARPAFAELESLEGQPAPGGDAISETAAISNVALNGAQVAAAKELIIDVAQGRLPRANGIMMLMNFFGFNAAQAEAIMGEVGRSFVPPPEDPAPERSFP